MSDRPSKSRLKYSLWKWKLLCFPLLALAFSSGAHAAVPSLLIDSQQTTFSGFNGPQSMTVNNTNQGVIFVADTGGNNIAVLLSGGYWAYITVPGFTLNSPQAVVLDAKGDLFIADSPANTDGSTYGRINEMPADSTGNLTGTAHLVFSGAPLVNPISLAVDSAGTLFIGDWPTDTEIGAVYSLAAGSNTLQT